MNRAKRYSGPFAIAVALIGFSLGIYLGGVVMAPKPEIRTVVQSPDHVAASMEEPVRPSIVTSADFNRYVAAVCPHAGLRTYQDGEVVQHVDLLACLVSAGISNKEGQTPAVTPQPYVLHPDKTPLTDPTQADYYRKLLEQGRFPVSGSAEGRPR